jgi:hypothetical protein
MGVASRTTEPTTDRRDGLYRPLRPRSTVGAIGTAAGTGTLTSDVDACSDPSTVGLRSASGSGEKQSRFIVFNREHCKALVVATGSGLTFTT